MIDLESIASPAEIRGADLATLEELASQIRHKIVETVSSNGGHLASSLGAVELSIALHYVYETPRDKIVWDVGHQGYPHKLLTGRASRFHTLRKRGGLSGFLRRSESEYDVFGAGHAGTSISAAVGLALARDVKGDSFKVVAVIGDGSLTCGLPFEGLNNAGHSGTDITVVLNDNEMSISENVGALAKYLNSLVQSRFYNKSKEEAFALVRRAPAGDRIIRLVHRLEESTKGLILPSIFFEDLGFRYIGPVDGHNLDELIRTFRRVRQWKGPVLVHAITCKGKGYKVAESDAVFWHSPPKFEAETGEYKKSTALSYTHVYGKTLVELAEADERVVAITAAMATGTGLVEFSEKFPRRFFDVGIAEAHAVTSAAGMAIEGLRPFVTIYSTFLQRAFDSIIHDVALQNLPVIFAMDRAGFVGFDGPTHHGLLDIAYMRIIPNMVVMAPRDEAELRDMMLTAKNYHGGPIAFRYPRAAVGGTDISRPPREIPIGKAELVHEGSSPVCLLSYGHIYANVMAAADILKERGLDVTIVNARFAKPLDVDMLRWAAERHEFVFSVEEGCAAGGFGSAVNEAFDEMGIGARCHILAVPDRFIEHGEQAWQQEEAGLSPSRIAERILAIATTSKGDDVPLDQPKVVPIRASSR
jgi:1-deoxy-D-xylulose-5-phosphate synthase